MKSFLLMYIVWFTLKWKTCKTVYSIQGYEVWKLYNENIFRVWISQLTMNKMFAPNSCFHVSSLVKYHWKRCNQCMKLLSSQARENPSSSEGPWSMYSQRVASGVLSKDPHQEKVVQSLQKVYDEVVAFQRPALKSQSAGSLFNFFRKSQPQKIIAPNGLYIFGSVGGGKTMLMDLFYETVPVIIITYFFLMSVITCSCPYRSLLYFLFMSVILNFNLSASNSNHLFFHHQCF